VVPAPAYVTLATHYGFPDQREEQEPAGFPAPRATQRQLEVVAAYVRGGGSISHVATTLGIRPSTAKRHLADLRRRSGLTTVELIYVGRAAGWLVVPSLETM
jgi:DNA-binding NarL/FixJ family response regulator